MCSLLQLGCHHKLDMFIPSHLVHHFLIPIGLRFRVSQYLCLWYHSGLYTMQELSYLCRFTLVSIWFRMVLTQIITWVYKDSLILTYPPNINIWWVRLWYHYIDYWYHAFTYILVQHWVDTKNILYGFVRGQHHLSTSWHPKMNFVSQRTNIECSSFKSPPHQLQACTNNLQSMETFCMQNNQPPTKSSVEFKENFIAQTPL